MVGKGAQVTGITAALRVLSSKGQSFTRSGVGQKSVHQEPPHTGISRTWATTVAFLVSATPKPESMSEVSYMD